MGRVAEKDSPAPEKFLESGEKNRKKTHEHIFVWRSSRATAEKFLTLVLLREAFEKLRKVS